MNRHKRIRSGLHSGRFGRMAGLFALSSALVSGCGYSNSSLHPGNIETVYVDMAQSRTFRRGIEFQLTEAIRKEIDLNTPYRNAPREKADTILSAEVLDWQESTLGRAFETDRPRETSATPVIRYLWQDVRSGRIIRQRKRWVTTVTYIEPVGESEANARLEGVAKLARRIVNDMQEDW